MDAAHGLAVADAVVVIGVVVSIIDIHERQPRCIRVKPLIPPAQEGHFPQAERAASVV